MACGFIASGVCRRDVSTLGVECRAFAVIRGVRQHVSKTVGADDVRYRNQLVERNKQATIV